KYPMTMSKGLSRTSFPPPGAADQAPRQTRGEDLTVPTRAKRRSLLEIVPTGRFRPAGNRAKTSRAERLTFRGPLVIEILAKLALAAAFAGGCAYAYLKLARKRKDVRRESLLVFGALFLFTVVRLLAIG